MQIANWLKKLKGQRFGASFQVAQVERLHDALTLKKRVGFIVLL